MKSSLLHDRWTEVDQPIKFTDSKNIVSQDDQNMHLIYFVTHVIFMCNDYGNRSLRLELTDETRKDLFNVATTSLVLQLFLSQHDISSFESQLRYNLKGRPSSK